MGQALNTTVNGNGGSCRAAADHLARLAGAAHTAAGLAHRARTTGESDWMGPARDAHDGATRQYGPATDRLGEQAGTIERALREFADELDGAIRRMEEALGKARRGGLMVEGPFILAPDPPLAPRVLPTGPCDAAQAKQVMADNKAAIEAHNAAIADYNAKAAVYNECKAIVTDARTREGDAHTTLQQAVNTAEPGDDYVGLGFTTASQARSFVATMENKRLEYANMANRFRNTGQAFTDFAMGKLHLLPPDFGRTLSTYAAAMQAGHNHYQARADQYNRWIKHVPQKARNIMSAYPGKGSLSDLEPGGSKALEHSRSLLKGYSYIGSTITAFNEFAGAVKGEQSWGKAVTDTGLIITGAAGGSMAAGAAYGALVGASGGPLGALVVGIAGGALGGIGGQWVADRLNPE
ncbi:hypothetical protein [Prauserella endophytica]|uniref:WXG100 family type VII secretion target n=1 Tax=Prauserella endophytica TaxID=1592324 RepID=A0ABY2RVG2_9PSEU|nr:hypothetical protein [Prauserella endophytica]TKG62027.1 hypothetical protein FCN18_32650 [Prauserella endophytica]